MTERQRWGIAELTAGAKVDRAAVEKQFGVGARTVKRDLADLTKRGLVEYIHHPRPGHYRLAKR